MEVTAEAAVMVKDIVALSSIAVFAGCPEMVIAGTSKKSLVLLESRSKIAPALLGDKYALLPAVKLLPFASVITVPDAETDPCSPITSILPALLSPGGSKLGSAAAYIFPEADSAMDLPKSLPLFR